jgi:hypothetical protein
MFLKVICGLKGKSRILDPVRSIFSIYLVLPAALGPEMNTRRS